MTTAVLLSAMTGVDDNDPETAKAEALAGTDFTQFLSRDALDGVRVGVPVWNDEAFEQYFEENSVTDSDQQESLREALSAGNEDALKQIETLSAAGVTAVEVPATAIPSAYELGVDVQAALEYGFKQAINTFLANLGEDAPVGSLEELIAFNNEDLANRAPYGQDHLEGSQNTAVSAAEYREMEQGNQVTARDALDQLFEGYDIDVVVSAVGQLYAPAGYPALTVPSGYAEDGTPMGIVFVGGFLSEPQLLAVGYAYEQATQARVTPDLEATMQLIESIGESSP